MVCEVWADPEDMCCDISEYSELEITNALLGASEILSEITNQRFGICEYSLRPCSCECLTACCCQLRTLSLDIPYGKPFVEVVSHTIYDDLGVEVIPDVGSYRIYPNYIIFTDTWIYGFAQNLNNNVGDPNTWQITVKAGEPIPEAGRLAAADLACELLKRCQDSCRLPAGIDTITRDGITMRFKTGSLQIRSVDLFLSYYMPTHFSGIIF